MKLLPEIRGYILILSCLLELFPDIQRELAAQRQQLKRKSWITFIIYIHFKIIRFMTSLCPHCSCHLLFLALMQVDAVIHAKDGTDKRKERLYRRCAFYGMIFLFKIKVLFDFNVI